MTTIEIIFMVIGSIVIMMMLVILIIILRKNNSKPNHIDGRNQQEIISKIEHLKTELKLEVEKLNISSKGTMNETFNAFKEAVSTKLSTDLQQMNEKVESRLKEGFTTSDELFKTMVEKLAIIDATQKNIESLSGHVTDLKTYLSDKKNRGMYGELQLYQILDNVFGENNKSLFDKQYKLNNGVVVDAVVYGSTKGHLIPIDSKFSLENYIRMYDDSLSKSDRQMASKLFEQNIKKHMDDISSKYIIKHETTDYALMFIPSEAVFSEIQANYLNLVIYGQNKKVWLASPTNLTYMLTVILMLNQDREKEKNAERMLLELTKLFKDFKLFFDRWEIFKKEMDKLSKSMDQLDKPMNRLNKNVYQIEKSNFDDLSLDDTNDR